VEPQLIDMERAAVTAWPALETAPLGGWLWRWSKGGSNRANSVACLAAPDRDTEAAIDVAEAGYRAAGAMPRFQVTDVSSPSDLAERLAARGYAETDQCTTLGLPLDGPYAMPPDVVVWPRLTLPWLEVYASTVTPDRSRYNPPILARIPEPAGFVAVVREGRVLATVLAVVVGRIAIMECVATAAAARRQGAARTAMTGALAFAQGQGATVAALGAVATNEPAQALYRGMGFEVRGRYHIRAKEKTS
jgi:GNAT superfamily N-acetyltransferase